MKIDAIHLLKEYCNSDIEYEGEDLMCLVLPISIKLLTSNQLNQFLSVLNSKSSYSECINVIFHEDYKRFPNMFQKQLNFISFYLWNPCGRLAKSPKSIVHLEYNSCSDHDEVFCTESDTCINPYHYKLVYVDSIPLDDLQLIAKVRSFYKPFYRFLIKKSSKDLTNTSNNNNSVDICGNNTYLNNVYFRFSIMYFNKRLLSVNWFKCKPLLIDGRYNIDDSSRISLGPYSYFVDKISSKCIRNLDKGIMIHLNETGEIVICNNISEHSLFVSAGSNKKEGSVWKIPQNTQHKMLVNQAQFMCKLKLDQKKISAPTPLLVGSPSNNNNSKLDLSNHSKIRQINISFIKGFGCEYQNRSISETPLWMKLKIFNNN